jgi:hypothetical protein
MHVINVQRCASWRWRATLLAWGAQIARRLAAEYVHAACNNLVQHSAPALLLIVQ